MTSTPGAEIVRIDSLTGLRLSASLLVILSHFPRVPDAPETLNVFLASGYYGVTLFFILSGFVLTWNYSAMAIPTWRGTRNFFVARVARIYPLYLTALALVVILARPWPDWRLVGLHAAALQTWMPRLDHAFALNGPGWSIGVEFFLYACFPVVIVLVMRLSTCRGLVLLAGVAVVLLAAITAIFAWTPLNDLPWDSPHSAHRWLYRTPLTRLPDFVVGAVLARLVACTPTARPRRLTTSLTQWGSILVIGALMSWAPLQYSAWSWDLAYLIPSAALIWALASNPATWLARLLAAPVVIIGGEISYAMYLFHVTLIGFVIAWVRPETPSMWGVSLLVTLALITLVSAGGHYLIERPAQRSLRRRFAPRTTPAPAEPGAAGSQESRASR